MEALLRRLVVSMLMIVFFMVLFSRCDAETDPLEVIALQDLYKALDFSPQLRGWQVYSSDPCGGSWTGVSCSGSTVLKIDLNGLALGGNLGVDLSSFRNLKHLDISDNNITGEIPIGLPPNASHMYDWLTVLPSNLSSNKLVLSIPHSMSSLMSLRHLNLSHNMLSGPIGNVFTGLLNLKEMDLSYNDFSGDLPNSFSTLKSLTKLYLQNNMFTGSVIFLADLQLTDLNIQDNHFSGIIPEHFQTIPNLWIGGNDFHTEAKYPPWKFPLENVSTGQNIPSLPTAESNAIESYPPLRMHWYKKKTLGPGGIALLVGGIALLTICTAFVVAVHINRARLKRNGGSASTVSSVIPPPISSNRDVPLAAPTDSPKLSTAKPILPVTVPRRLPPISQIAKGRISRRSFSRKCKMPPSAKLYSISELQSAANSFSRENFLGQGALGSVYRAEFPDGQVFAVKNIETVPLSLREEEQFLDVVSTISRLRHPNIVRLIGYCIENGQHLLLFEYVRNLSLDDALHCEYFMPLTWGIRLQIAVGIAQALDYLHSMSPAVSHLNLKAANILLDDDLTPRLCDSGLATLRPLASNSVKLKKASEIAINNFGYIAPEQGQAGSENTKTDVYAFGVLLLELLTGRRPFDSSRPEEEKCLAKWASKWLHDGNALEDVVDPVIKRSFKLRDLSRFADIVLMCIQPEKEFRLPMSEVVEALAQLLPKPGIGCAEGDMFEKSFRSTRTRFPGSPTISHMSF